MENASARNMWGDFLDAHLEYAFHEAPKTIHFCDNQKDADAGVDLVKKGSKKVTCQSLLGLQYRKERLPKIGDFMVITNWEGKAQCIVRITAVTLKPLFGIGDAYIKLEGDKNQSLENWKKIHWDYFQRELAPFGRVPRESMIVVCQEFEKVFQR